MPTEPQSQRGSRKPDTPTAAEAIEAFALGNRTGILVVEKGQRRGEIHLDNGVVVHAVYGELVGTSAAVALTNLPSATVDFRPTPAPKGHSTRLSFMQLVLEAARDRAENPSVETETAPPKPTPRFAEIWPPRVRLGTAPGAPIVVLDKALTSVGRSARNDIVIPNPSISSRHAYFRIRPSGVVLSDLGSGGGTFVRGRRIKDARLGQQEPISFGDFPAAFFGGLLPPAGTPGVPETAPCRDLKTLFEKLIDPETEWHEIHQRLEALGSLRPKGPHLVLFEGGDIRVFPLAKPRIVVGRDPRCDIPITHHGTSRHHAEIISGPDGFEIRDCASANGTFVRGKAIQTLRLQSHERLFFGAAEAIFVAGEPRA